MDKITQILTDLKAGKTVSAELMPHLEQLLVAAGARFGRRSLELPKVAEGAKVLGTLEQPVTKVLPIHDLKVEKAADGLVTVKGYANTKNLKDRYGDIPTVFPQLRNYVYETSDFLKNPVMLMDHDNEVGSIAGSYKVVKEDDLGLYVEGVFSQSDYGPVAHARTVYAEGHGKAFSIAGLWYFEDKDNPDHLTYAKIFEISLVGVGADPNALGYTEQPRASAAPAPAARTEKDKQLEKQLEDAIREMRNQFGLRKLREELKKLGDALAQA